MRALALAFALLFLAGCSEKTEQTRPNFLSVAITKGKSMLPAFSELEPVWLEHCGWDELKTGDTVIFWSGDLNAFVHHRITEKSLSGNGWLTRGDNNAVSDPGLMTRDEFIGRTRKM